MIIDCTVFLYIHFCDLKMAHSGRNMSSSAQQSRIQDSCVLTYPTPSPIACNTTGMMHLKITTIGFISASYIKSAHSRCLRMQRYQAVRVPEEVQRLRERDTVLRYMYIPYLSSCCCGYRLWWRKKDRLLVIQTFYLQLMHQHIIRRYNWNYKNILKVLRHVSDHTGSFIREPCTVVG